MSLLNLFGTLTILTLSLTMALKQDQLETLVKATNPGQVLIITDQVQEDFHDLTSLVIPWQTVLFTSLDKEIVQMLRNQKDSLIILDLPGPILVPVLLSQMTLPTLTMNVWMVFSQQNTSMSSLFSFADPSKSNVPIRRWSLQVQMYYLNTDNLEITEVLGNANLAPTFKICGNLGSTCNLDVAIANRKARKDHQGQTIVVSYENWSTYCIVDPVTDELIGGRLPEVFDEMANFLNITVKLELFLTRSTWATQESNGSWTGAIADIMSGRHEASIAGFAVTEQRSKVVDMLPPIGINYIGVIVKTPSQNDITFSNYTNEFTTDAWIAIFVAFAICWIVMLVLLFWARDSMNYWKKRVKVFRDILLSTTNVVLRSFINKGSPSVTETRLSLRIGFFTLLLMALMLMNFYKSLLKALFTVHIQSLSINSYQDILDSDLNVINYKGSSTEEMYKAAPKESILNQIYIQKAKDYPGFYELGHETVIDRIIDNKAIFHGNLDDFLHLDEYPCKLTDVKLLRLPYSISYPFTMESPFFDAFAFALKEVQEFGIIHKVEKRHSLEHKERITCGAPVISLGYPHTFLPFGIMFLGILAAIAQALLEGVTLKFKGLGQTHPKFNEKLNKRRI